MMKTWDSEFKKWAKYQEKAKKPATKGVSICTTILGRDDKGLEGSHEEASSRKTCPEISGKPCSENDGFAGRLTEDDSNTAYNNSL